MTEENTLPVQIAMIIMLLSWIVAPIVALINWLSDWNLDGWAENIFIWPMILIALLTLNGTPTKKVK